MDLIEIIQIETDYIAELNEYTEGIDDEDERVALAARLRLVRAFLTNTDNRMLCVVARLIAVSTLGIVLPLYLTYWNLDLFVTVLKFPNFFICFFFIF